MTRRAFESEAMYSMLHRLQAEQDIGDIFEDIELKGSPSVGLEAATFPARQLELALGWIDTSIPVSLYVFINGAPDPLRFGPLRGGKVFALIPSTFLRPGTNKLQYRIHFWASGWKYQLWIKVGSESRKLAEGKDATPGNSKGDMEYGQREIEL